MSDLFNDMHIPPSLSGNTFYDLLHAALICDAKILLEELIKLMIAICLPAELLLMGDCCPDTRSSAHHPEILIINIENCPPCSIGTSGG
jgi:hypothetical protein